MISTRVRVLGKCALAASAVLLAGMPALAQSKPKVYQLKLAGVSQPLRDIAAEPEGKPIIPRLMPQHRRPWVQDTPAEFEDTAVQQTVGPLVGTTNLVNVDGIGANGSAPPDTNGSVGATQFVQTVNTEYAVYDKTTGHRTLGPIALNNVWKSVGGICSMTNNSDPIVLYDKAAGRWLLSIWAFNSSGSDNKECIAVSTTSDATGTYNLYTPDFGSSTIDYPKFGVWPDAYYFSANIFDVTGSFVAPEACAFDRAAMIAGKTAAVICFQAPLNGNDFSILPSDLDGSAAPPVGEPNFFLELFTNNNNTSTTGTQLHMFKFHVDFVTPSNSSLTGPTTITVNSYSLGCGGGVCVPQSSTSQKLDSLGDRLMFRLAYRNFGTFEALTVSHSVKAASKGTQMGERWYEIRNPNGTPTVQQQSTFSPDTSLYRWMGGIAEDKVGDFALGYSDSSSKVHPGIRYTGRVPTDPVNTMEAEATIFTGAGSQNGQLDRWGDYSSMSIDPVDDCTFWYTTEYIPANGSFNWHTRIASFKFPSCH